MNLLKISGKVALFIILFSLIAAILFYFNYLTPKQRAERHLDFIHNAIKDMHPAILEPEAQAFHQWHKNGYEQAKSLLAKVKTEADENALLRFYFAGYQDSHLNGYLDHTPYSKIDADKSQWTGWLLKATNTGYVVNYRKEGDVYPPENARLLSCDGHDIDELLHKHYAPYIDARWNILLARDSAAKALTQKRSFIGVLDRLEINNCDFQVNERIIKIPVKWSFMSKEESDQINAKSYNRYQLPSLSEFAPGKIWIRARDFALYTPEAVQSQKKLLTTITAAKDKNLIVLDTRGNGGGSSTHGTNIFNAIFEHDEKGKEYLDSMYYYKIQGSNALFRASWPFYWSYNYGLKKVIANQGHDSAEAKYREKFLARLKKSLDSGEPTLYQSEKFNNSLTSRPPAKNWESTLKIVLITDKFCASACLDFVDLLKLIPNLLHVGEPTNADTVYTEIAHMQSEYFKETFNFIVPVKKWNKRLREDNQPYIPDITYEGDMNNEEALKQWVLAQAEQHFNKENKNYAHH